jgi:hypothetical protein
MEELRHFLSLNPKVLGVYTLGVYTLEFTPLKLRVY